MAQGVSLSAALSRRPHPSWISQECLTYMGTDDSMQILDDSPVGGMNDRSFLTVTG